MRKFQRALLYFIIACLIIAASIALMIRYQFLFMRYHFEYYFEAVKWSLNTECSRARSVTESTDHYPNAEWGELIARQLATVSDRWVVSKPPVGLGLCNRILNTLSCLLLAMATNRTLWVEWEEQETEQITSNEIAGMSSFDDLFESALHDRRFRPPTQLIENATMLHNCFHDNLRFSADLNNDYTATSIRIDSGEWWGGLLLRNKAYTNTIFKGLNPIEGFPILFRSMFSLHPPHVQPVECSWMIQYRTIWTPPRYTAPIQSFLDCARARGMTPDDYRTTYIVTDDITALLQGASPEGLRVLTAMNLPEERATCRGPCGDRHAMETMYRLSHCRNAVLTFGSSFGSCIANLAATPRQFRVSHYGDCLPTDGPVDINTYSRHGNIATYLTHLPD